MKAQPRQPVPPQVSFEVALLDDDLPNHLWREEAKRIIRRFLFQPDDDPPDPLFDDYDEELAELMLEVVSEN